MKKVFLALTLILFLAVPAHALDASRSGQKIKRLEQAQTRIQTIKDANRQKIAQFINQQLERIQNQAVRHFNNVLERLRRLLTKIKNRVPAIDITAAQTAIESAQKAVDDLADNVYVIEFTAESGLRVGASSAKTQLRSDIKAVFEKVRLARQAVVAVLEAAKEL